jgi:squalene-associated FAD-dependent desaturase
LAGIDPTGRVVVAGAGLAGLVAAEWLSAMGRQVLVIEASSKAGGRCRSYHDDRLGRVIDNGNHLILSANTHVLAWAERIGGAASLHIGKAAFPFLDLENGSRYDLSPGRGPFGGFSRSARPPGVSLTSMAAQMAHMVLPKHEVTVAKAVPDRGALWRQFWDPMTRAILNEAPENADAGLLRATMLRTFAQGAGACRPVLATGGLGPALVDPALQILRRRGVEVRLRSPLRAIRFDGDRAVSLETGAGDLAFGPQDHLILALPAKATAALLPDLPFPAPGMTILNAHFLAPENGLPPILALIGGSAQWLFRRGDVVSVTVSAAEASPVSGLGREAALTRLWADVALAIGAHGGRVPPAMPTARLLRERAATFAQSPGDVSRRQPTITRWKNVTLAGDHVQTGLPATLEGAVISGERAADAAERDRGRG